MNLRDAGAYLELGKTCRGQGRWPEAEAALRKALEFDPENVCAHVELGVLYEDQVRFAQAEAELEKAIAVDRNNGWAQCHLGRIYRRQGRLSESGAALRKALELDPRNAGFRIELGALYEEQSEFKQAEAEFERALALDPNYAVAHCQIGRFYRRQGRWPESEAALHKALELDPQNIWSHSELGSLYQDQDRLPEAEAEFQKALAIDPRSGSAHFHLGEIHGSRGRMRDAEAEFEKAVANDPNNAGAHFCLGNIHLRCGRWAEAEAEFQSAAVLDPRNDGAYIGLWAVYRGQGRTAEAAAASQKASAINPRNAWACTVSPELIGLDKDSGERAAGLTREKVFCLLPWTHLHVCTGGSSIPCCVWRGPALGNVRSASLVDLWNSPGMKALRSDMMSGRPVAGCEKCYEDERAGFLSLRQRNNLEWDRHRGRERLTALDGTMPWLPVPLLDIRFSNACNLRCRTCDVSLSSAWTADARSLGLAVGGSAVQRSYGDWDSLWRQLQRVLEEGIEEIRFAGGEPLVMEEHYRILDFLIARGLTDVRLSYNTNFSILRFQGRDVIDRWSRFRKVHIAASLDGSGRRGEYLRKGLSWDAVVANREEMLRRCPDVSFMIAATVSIFNALHLPDFHREWVEKGYVDRDAFSLNMLVAPDIYQAQALPPALKSRVRESYRRHRESFLAADGPAARAYAAAERYMEASARDNLLPGFVAMTRRLDALRGEDCREVFPELAGLFEAVA